MNELNQLEDVLKSARDIIDTIKLKRIPDPLKITTENLPADKLDNYLARALQQHLTAIHSLSRIDIIYLAKLILKTFIEGKKILICGNGGSAADAQHIAAEFVVKFREHRQALPMIALTTDTSILTATGNDFSFDDIFSRQIEAIGNDGDMLIAISTSGKSTNVIKALKAAAEKNMLCVGISGSIGFDMTKDHVDIQYNMFSDVTARIQETYLTFLHLVCDVVDQFIKGSVNDE